MKKSYWHWLQRIALALEAALMLPTSALATDYTAVANGDWSADATWSGTGYPAASDDAAIINATRTINVDVSPTINSLTLSGSSWNLANAASPNTLTTRTLLISLEGSMGSNVTLVLTGNGTNSQTGDGVILNGTFVITNGATLTATGFRYNGSGAMRVEAGGAFDLNGGHSINYYDASNGMAFINNGRVRFNKAGAFYHYARTIAGGGEWQMNSNGTLTIGSAYTTFALDPDTALWTGNEGLLIFAQGTNAATHTLGGFNMGGNSRVQFSRTANYQISRNSTFKDLIVADSFSGTIDAAPAGGGKTHYVNGTLWLYGNETPVFASGDAGGAVFNVTFFTNSAMNTVTVGSNVTLSLAGSSHGWDNNGSHMTLYGTLNVRDGATLTITTASGDLMGSGTLDVDSGGTVVWNHGGGWRKITTSIVNDGLIVFTGLTKRYTTSGGANPLNISGTGTFRVEGSAQVQLHNTPTVIEGWSGSGAFNSRATWHMNGNTTPLTLPGNSPNIITSIGTNATVILENGGKIQELNYSARNALTVYGKLGVRGTSNLAFNDNQSLTIASGGTLAGDGTITVGGAGKVEVQSGGTLAAEINGATATTLTVSGGPLIVSGFVDVKYTAPPTVTEYRIATAPSVSCTATTTGEPGWKTQVRGGAELWIVKRDVGTVIMIK